MEREEIDGYHPVKTKEQKGKKNVIFEIMKENLFFLTVIYMADVNSELVIPQNLGTPISKAVVAAKARRT